MNIGQGIKNDFTDMSSIKIYLLDEDSGRNGDDYPNLEKLEERWMISLGSLGNLDSVQGGNKRDDARFLGT